MKHTKKILLRTLCIASTASTFIIGSTDLLAAVFTGKLYLKNSTDCQLVLDPDQINDHGAAQYTDQVIKKGKTSKKIKYSLDTAVFAEAGAEAGASCELFADGAIEAKWRFLLKGKVEGEFSTEAECNAHLKTEFSSSIGLKPGASLTIPGHAINANGQKTSNFSILIKQKSNKSINISANFEKTQACGDDNGIYTFSQNKTLLASTAIISNNFDKYTIVAEKNNSPEKLLSVAREEFSTSVFGRHTGSFLQVNNHSSYQPIISLHSITEVNGGYKLLMDFQINIITAPIQTFPSMSKVINVNKFSDIKKLRFCYVSGPAGEESSYIFFPTQENPTAESCTSEEVIK